MPMRVPCRSPAGADETSDASAPYSEAVYMLPQRSTVVLPGTMALA